MKLKKILRIVFYMVYWVLFGYIVRIVVSGNGSLLDHVALGFYIGNITLHLLKCALDRYLYSQYVKKFKDVYNCLTQSHKHRYACLLKGDIEMAKKFEELIKLCSDAILQVGPNIAKYKEITSKERKEVNEIIDKTKVLITRIRPPV